MARKVDAQQLELEAVPTLTVPRGEDKPYGSTRGGSATDLTATSEGRCHTPVRRPDAADLVETPGALLTRSDLRGLGLGRRAIDAVFRALPVVALPGYSRPMIRAEHYLELVEEHTYRDDRVRSCRA